MRRSLSLPSSFLVLGCLAAGLLTGCGQKGPLFMPPPTKATPAPASSTVKPQPALNGNSIVPDNQRPASGQY